MHISLSVTPAERRAMLQAVPAHTRFMSGTGATFIDLSELGADLVLNLEPVASGAGEIIDVTAEVVE